jgi:glutathione S-transferase
MPSDLVFYTNPMSRGRIARWMLEETGVDYRTEILAYGPEMHTAEYLALNPLGKVPTIRHGAVVVTECAAICAYLADTFPEAELAPPNGERGAYYRWLFFAAGPLEAAIINRALGFEVPKDRGATVGYGPFERMMDTLEAAVSAADFIAGPRFTAADVYVGSQVGWGLQFGTMEERPAFRAYWERIADRPACLRARERDDAAMPAGA